MKKNRPNIKTYCAKTILLLTLVYIYIPASLQGQTEVSSIKLPSGPQGASVVYDVIHAGNYIFALSYDKLLVFNESDGTYANTVNFGLNYGKFNPLSVGYSDYHYLSYHASSNTVYAVSPELKIFAVDAGNPSYSWSFDPLINQEGETLHDRFSTLNDRFIMRCDDNHGRMYLLVSGKNLDIGVNGTGNFHANNFFFGIYNINSASGTWSLHYDEYINYWGGNTYYEQINNVIFNEDPTKDFYYITRMGFEDGVVQAFEVTSSGTQLIQTISIPNPAPTPYQYYRLGKMLSVYNDDPLSPINKILVFPDKYPCALNEDCLANFCVIDGNHTNVPGNIQAICMEAPSRRINDAVFLPQNQDLVLSYAPDDSLIMDEANYNTDIAVFHYTGILQNPFIEAVPFSYNTESSALQLDNYDMNPSLKLLQINDGAALISKKDGVSYFYFDDTESEYVAEEKIDAESNFYVNGAKGNSKSFLINTSACRLDIFNNNDGSCAASVPVGYCAHNITGNEDGSKLYFYNTTNSHNIGLYIWNNGPVVNINDDGYPGNDISSAIGDCIYNPNTNQFLISEHTSYNGNPAKIIVINDDANNTKANITFNFQGDIPEYLGEMFIAPNNKLYVMANMRKAEGIDPVIYIFNATTYAYECKLSPDMPSFNEDFPFYSGFFCYNPHNEEVYATIHPTEYTVDPYHSVKNSMFNLGITDYYANGVFFRLSYPVGEDLIYLGKIIVPDNSDISSETQYQDKMFVIGEKFYEYNYASEDSAVKYDQNFNDITYCPVHDKLIALRDGQDGDVPCDRVIEVYYIEYDGPGLVFNHVTSLDFDGQAAHIFYNPIDCNVYIYNKSDDEKLGGIQAKMLFFDPSENNPTIDSIPLGFMSFYRELDHTSDHHRYFYNITEPYINTNNNRLFVPNGGFSTVSMIQLEPREVLHVREGITWLSFPRLDRYSGDPEPDVVIGGSNIIPGYDQGSYLRTLNKDQLAESVFDGSFWPSNNIQTITSPEGYKLELFPSSSRYVEMVGDVMDPTTPMDLSASYDNWIGYFLEEPMRVEDAFVGYWDQIYSVKHQDWVIYGYQAPPPNPDGAMDFTLRYGDMVIVDVVNDIGDFQWPSGDGAAIKMVLKPDYFTYEEKLDYTSFTVELDPGSMPLEVGVYEDSICVGASAVEDSIVQINAYTSDSAGYNPEITFALEYGLKSGKKDRVRKYKVYNSVSGKMEQRHIHGGEHDKFY
jgi:hypothetical protein